MNVSIDIGPEIINITVADELLEAIADDGATMGGIVVTLGGEDVTFGGE